MVNKYDIIAIAETFLDEKVKDEVIGLEGFEFLRIDRQGREGGGVIIYYRKEFKPKELECSKVDSASNYIIMDLDVNGEKLLFGLIYRPPKTP